MKATLLKKFGNLEKGTSMDANDKLYKHLLNGGWIEKPKAKTTK